MRTRTGKIAIPSNAVGPRALLLSAIALAANDAAGKLGRQEDESHVEMARVFLQGETYRHYLGLLGLPTNWQPEMMEEIS